MENPPVLCWLKVPFSLTPSPLPPPKLNAALKPSRTSHRCCWSRSSGTTGQAGSRTPLRLLQPALPTPGKSASSAPAEAKGPCPPCTHHCAHATHIHSTQHTYTTHIYNTHMPHITLHTTPHACAQHTQHTPTQQHIPHTHTHTHSTHTCHTHTFNAHITLHTYHTHHSVHISHSTHTHTHTEQRGSTQPVLVKLA